MVADSSGIEDEVLSGGGEVRGKEFSDGSDANTSWRPSSCDSDQSGAQSADDLHVSSLVDAALSAENAAVDDGATALMSFENLPRQSPTDSGAKAPRGRRTSDVAVDQILCSQTLAVGRPSDVHKLTASTHSTRSTTLCDPFGTCEVQPRLQAICPHDEVPAQDGAQTPRRHSLPLLPSEKSSGKGTRAQAHVRNAFGAAKRPCNVPGLKLPRRSGRLAAGGDESSQALLTTEAHFETGQLAPRRSTSVNVMYQGEGSSGLRWRVRALAIPLRDEIAAAKNLSQDLVQALGSMVNIYPKTSLLPIYAKRAPLKRLIVLWQGGKEFLEDVREGLHCLSGSSEKTGRKCSFNETKSADVCLLPTLARLQRTSRSWSKSCTVWRSNVDLGLKRQRRCYNRGCVD